MVVVGPGLWVVGPGLWVVGGHGGNTSIQKMQRSHCLRFHMGRCDQDLILNTFPLNPFDWQKFIPDTFGWNYGSKDAFFTRLGHVVTLEPQIVRNVKDPARKSLQLTKSYTWHIWMELWLCNRILKILLGHVVTTHFCSYFVLSWPSIFTFRSQNLVYFSSSLHFIPVNLVQMGFYVPKMLCEQTHRQPRKHNAAVPYRQRHKNCSDIGEI